MQKKEYLFAKRNFSISYPGKIICDAIHSFLPRKRKRYRSVKCDPLLVYNRIHLCKMRWGDGERNIFPKLTFIGIELFSRVKYTADVPYFLENVLNVRATSRRENSSHKIIDVPRDTGQRKDMVRRYLIDGRFDRWF